MSKISQERIERIKEEILRNSVNPTETYKNQILPQKLSFYIQYVHSQSFFGDIKIILRRVIVIQLEEFR